MRILSNATTIWHFFALHYEGTTFSDEISRFPRPVIFNFTTRYQITVPSEGYVDFFPRSNQNTQETDFSLQLHGYIFVRRSIVSYQTSNAKRALLTRNIATTVQIKRIIHTHTYSEVYQINSKFPTVSSKYFAFVLLCSLPP